jgi:transposase InsO family protein
LGNLIAAVPYKIHTILTDNGVQFTNLEHRRTQPAHPWTNGQVERMNKTIKQATVHRYYYENHGQLKEHLQNEFIINSWKNSPLLFKINPSLLNMGPYSYISDIIFER